MKSPGFALDCDESAFKWRIHERTPEYGLVKIIDPYCV